MRLSGLASGFDTDEMVKNLMKVERMKVDRYEQNKQIALWRQESYNSMNKLFANFILNTKKDMGLKHTNSTGSIFDSSYKSLSYIKKATSSNESAATVTTGNKAINGTYKIDVEQLAEGASFTSAKITNEKLKDSEGNPMKELKFKINGADVVVGDGKKDITMDDVAKAINSTTKNEGGKEVPLGVTAFYDEKNGRLFMQTTEVGEGAKITLTEATVGDTTTVNNGNVLIKALQWNKDVINDKNEKVPHPDSMKSSEGQNAIIKYNGVELKYDSNKIHLNGLNIELKSQGVTTVNVSTNTDGIMEKIEKLVADYNELIDTASKLVGEKKYSQYKPLSSEERKAMSEEDLKLWDEKSKSGMLNGDETIQRTLQAMRTNLYKTVEGLDGKFKHITEIGISTEKYSKGAAGGKLQIDTNKLRQAIEEDAEGVMELLFKDDGGDPTDTKNTTNGLFTNAYDDIIDGMKAIIDKSGPGEDSELFRGVKSNMLIDFVTKKGSISDLDKSVMEMNKQIDNLTVLLAKKEDSYYAKFTAMEKYMYQMNGQSGWLAQQFG